MRTLRTRLTALFIGAILAVVALATWIFFFILDYPHTNPLLEQVRLILTIAQKSEGLRRLGPGDRQADKQIGFRSARRLATFWKGQRVSFARCCGVMAFPTMPP